MIRMEDHNRFWRSVDIRRDTDCWEWRLSTGREGYGRFWHNHRMVLSHRFAYEDTFGEVPKDQIVRHKCSNKTCCNPFHLVAGTHSDNLLDAYRNKERRAPSPHYRKFYKGELDLIIDLYNKGIPANTLGKMFLSSPHLIASIIRFPATHYQHIKELPCQTRLQ